MPAARHVAATHVSTVAVHTLCFHWPNFQEWLPVHLVSGWFGFDMDALFVPWQSVFLLVYAKMCQSALAYEIWPSLGSPLVGYLLLSLFHPRDIFCCCKKENKCRTVLGSLFVPFLNSYFTAELWPTSVSSRHHEMFLVKKSWDHGAVHIFLHFRLFLCVVLFNCTVHNFLKLLLFVQFLLLHIMDLY